jgi:hypothetical protein
MYEIQNRNPYSNSVFLGSFLSRGSSSLSLLNVSPVRSLFPLLSQRQRAFLGQAAAFRKVGPAFREDLPPSRESLPCTCIVCEKA